MTDPHALLPQLVAYLNAHGGLAGVTGGWHEAVAPLGTADPFGVVTLIVVGVERAMSGYELDWVCDVDVQVVCRTAAEATTLAAALHAALDGAAIGLRCRRTDVIRYPERDGSKLWWHAGGTYTITT